MATMTRPSDQTIDRLSLPINETTAAGLRRASKNIPWLTTARRLLSNLTCSWSVTPTELELFNLHISLKRYESDQIIGLQNIGAVRNFLFDPKRHIARQLRRMAFSFSTSADHNSEYAASFLSDFISELSEYSSRRIYNER